MHARWLAALLGMSAACSSPAPPPRPLVSPVPSEVLNPLAEGAEVGDPEPADPRLERDIAAMLERVARVRSLEPKQPVDGARLPRNVVAKLVMEKTDKELPKGVLEAQGEMLRGFGLIATDYDFVGGIYALIEDNLAGFYDQHVDKMFILDDLSEEAVAETLAHELVHALQDQHFDLTTMLHYTPGESDRVTAGHALAEGDAMSAMFDLTLGDARKVSATKLRVAMVASVAFSPSGNKTPRVLQASLIAPYVDGFRFVQELRARGGWKAVNDAYATLPVSTEQLLHVDKYLANEPPVRLAVPALPPGYGREDQDVLGEQGLRMVFEQWATNREARAAAAGWGGDRFVVGRKAVANGGQAWAAAWHVRFDTLADAKEAGALMKKRHPKPCTQRVDLGPFAWKQKGTDLVIAVGPFAKAVGGDLSSVGTCADAANWVAKLLQH